MNIDLLFQISEKFFLGYLIFYITYILIGNIMATVKLYKRRQSKLLMNQLDHEYYYPVSIVVPAFNESKTIITTIDNLLHLDYKIYEIIVVDDGSTDDTAQKVIDRFNMVKNDVPIRLQVPSQPIESAYEISKGGKTIKLIRKVNGGNKADAVNAGINASEYPYFVSMDADEVLQADALKNAIQLFFENDRTVAVGGLLGIANDVVFKDAYPVETPLPKNLVAAMQTLEYGRAFMGSRISSDAFNANFNVSGGFGLFKKQAVIDINGYDPNSVGEDMDLALRLHRHHVENDIPYKIRFAEDAVCWTQAPFSMDDLAKQRARWHRGLMQAMWAHKSILLNPNYGLLGLLSYPYFLMYELLAPFIELLGLFIIILGLYLGMINIPMMLVLMGLYFIFNLFQTMAFFVGRYFIQDYKRYPGEVAKAFFVTTLDAFFFRPYLLWVRLYSVFTYHAKLHSWAPIERGTIEDQSVND